MLPVIASFVSFRVIWHSMDALWTLSELYAVLP